MTINKQAKISLVGAGPGDEELITVKGLRCIQNADVILYDALANPNLLQHAPKNALLINVGKRANKHRFAQEEINQMLVSYAFTHGHVLRLKGGDPFVFGRGFEELDYARSFGLPVTYIPGISSAIAVPGLANVPATSRGVSRSFWVLTATNKEGGLSADLKLATQSSATLIILMGIRKLPEIIDLFQKAGKGEVPAVVIQNGSLANQRSVSGKVDNLLKRAQDQKIGAPGIIVIGQVAAFANQVEKELKNRALHAVPFEQ